MKTLAVLFMLLVSISAYAQQCPTGFTLETNSAGKMNCRNPVCDAGLNMWGVEVDAGRTPDPNDSFYKDKDGQPRPIGKFNGKWVGWSIGAYQCPPDPIGLHPNTRWILPPTNLRIVANVYPGTPMNAIQEGVLGMPRGYDPLNYGKWTSVGYTLTFYDKDIDKYPENIHTIPITEPMHITEGVWLLAATPSITEVDIIMRDNRGLRMKRVLIADVPNWFFERLGPYNPLPRIPPPKITVKSYFGVWSSDSMYAYFYRGDNLNEPPAFKTVKDTIENQGKWTYEGYFLKIYRDNNTFIKSFPMVRTSIELQ